MDYKETHAKSPAVKSSKKRVGKSVRMKLSRIHKPEALELEEWQRQLRQQYGEQQNYLLENKGNNPIFSDYLLTNPLSQKTYKIAIRGETPGDNYCSCPDFSINNLGTCKHIAFALSQLMKISGADEIFRKGCNLPYSEIFLNYGLKRQVRFRAGENIPEELLALVRQYFNEQGFLKDEHILDFHHFLGSIPQQSGHEVRCYDDVMACIAEHQDEEHRRRVIKTCLKKGIDSPVFKNILKVGLYPYQREGALFAVQSGRCLIGDDMGLGKTIQALAASELMALLFQIRKVLIVSPTSLKYQWKSEIEKFTKRDATVIEGFNHQRKGLYKNDSFFKMVNYELVWRDMDMIREWAPDLIILDEAQRIKNWKTRTAKYVKQLESPFAIVLTGTPIENRIEELHSLMEFVDRHHLGPLYRFVHRHQILDNGGKVIGYKDLESVRHSLKDVMIRRKKDEVLKQLPERIDKNFFVPMTKEQQDIHNENYEIVVRLVAKWRRYKFLSEVDQRRMQIALSMMRMAADNTYLVDKKTFHGPKIEELAIILQELILEEGEKVVIFSQWLRMTELVEQVLRGNGITYVHLSGMVPSHQRKELITRFREDPDCKVFLSTDAGGVGLNLQSGSVVINMDIPWNPAVLEQRIGRVHRLGQRRMVRVINFVTKSSIEERILDLLRFKKSLFTGALDEGGQDVVMIGDSQLKKLMQSVDAVTDQLEKPDPAREIQEQLEVKQDEAITAQKEAEADDGEAKGSTAANLEIRPQSLPLEQLLIKGAEFLTNISQVLSQGKQTPQEAIKKQLNGIVGKDETTGKTYLKIPMPEPEIVQEVFSTLGGLLANFMRTKE
ncbi:MAG: DEAD/DEAH box helicase [Smithellaceae bacterium]